MKKSLGAMTLIYPEPVLIIGSYDMEGKPNLMTAAWGGICCSEPPCLAVSIRPSRHSYLPILERKSFTVNIAGADQVTKADYYGIVSGRDNDKFAATDITPVKSLLVDAPYGDEFPVVLECAVLTTLELGSHVQIIGEILDVKADESILSVDGFPQIEMIKPLIFDSGSRNYYTVGGSVARAFSSGNRHRIKK